MYRKVGGESWESPARAAFGAVHACCSYHLLRLFLFSLVVQAQEKCLNLKLLEVSLYLALAGPAWLHIWTSPKRKWQKVPHHVGGERGHHIELVTLRLNSLPRVSRCPLQVWALSYHHHFAFITIVTTAHHSWCYANPVEADLQCEFCGQESYCRCRKIVPWKQLYL